MKLVEGDLIDLEPTEAAFAGLSQVLGTPVDGPPVRAGPYESTLGGDDEILGIGVESLGDESLAHLGAVGVGGVDEVDVELERSTQNPLRLLAIGRISPDTWSRNAHCTVTQPVDGQVATDVDGSRLGSCDGSGPVHCSTPFGYQG